MLTQRWFPSLPNNLSAEAPKPKKTPARGVANRSALSSKIAASTGGLSDEQVRDVRGMYQFQCVPIWRIAIIFNRDPAYIGTLVRYLTRRHIEPLAADYPRGQQGRRK